MKAVRFAAAGDPQEVLTCVEADRPLPRPGEVLVRMLASPVNPSDLMYVRGNYTVQPVFPAAPGFEGVGIVEASGGGLRGRLFTGRRVVVLNRAGGNWADYAVVSADQVIPVSRSLSDEQAATFFVNPATAWVMTQEILRIPRDAWLLQTASASSLGQMIVRLGRHCGFRTFNVVRKSAHVEMLRKLGADHVCVFDGQTMRASDLQTEIVRVTGQPTIRYAIDPVGGATASAVVACLGDDARMLLYGTLSGEPVSFSPRTLMRCGALLQGFWLGGYMRQVRLPKKLLLVRRITRLIQQGILASTIRDRFPLEQVAMAVRSAESAASEGKVLLRMTAPA